MALEVQQTLTIGGTTYRVAAHPAVPDFPYGQEGRQGVVYQLTDDAGHRALKLFKAAHRRPALVAFSEKLAAFAELPGLSVCRRTVLTPQSHAGLLRAEPDLTYAVLMPWIDGPTWMEVLLEKRELSAEVCLRLARSLAGILAEMEQRGLAHCDLSGANMLIPGLAGAPAVEPVALVDVEQLFGPGLDRPDYLPSGSSGYAHRAAAGGIWSANADRFSGAVLLAEILGWCDSQVRQASWGEAYFGLHAQPAGGAGMQEADLQRYRLLLHVLDSRWGTPVAGLLERAWRSEALAECATFGEWLLALPSKPTQLTAPMLAPPLAAESAPVLPPAPTLLPIARAAGAGRLTLLCSLTGRPAAVTALAFAPAGDLLAVGCTAGQVVLGPVQDWQQAVNLPAPPGPVTALCFSPDGQLLVTGGRDGTLRVWETADASLLATLRGHTGGVSALAFSPEGAHLASAGQDGTVRLWAVAGGTCLRTLQAHAGGLLGLAFSPDGRLLATGGYDGARLWKLPTLASLPVLKGQAPYVRAIAFSPDGRLLATGAADGAVRLWDMAGGTPAGTRKGHSAQVEALAFSPDGALLASGSADRTLRLWSLERGEPLQTLRGCNSSVTGVGFSSDGYLLAGAAFEGVRLWGARSV